MLLSLDISTSCIGYSVFNKKNTLLEMNFIKFNSKQNLFEKLEEFKKKISHLLKLEITSIAIEEPLQKFQGKFSSAHTISVLNFFNGMISSFLYSSFKIEPIYYNVNNARAVVLPGFKIKKDGASTKHQIWEKVVEMEPQINWKYGIKSRKLLEENYDMADSYIIGKCFIKMLEIQKNKIKN
jgi:Holliday junction resolvasome RuvABC endonuclease subunit